jgi:hypothetical protein
MRAFPLVAAIGLVAAGAFALGELRAASPSPVAAPARAATTLADEPPPSATAAPPPDARSQIRRAIEVAQPSLRTQADVERYLGELEARARRNHQITALEVEPGLAAIRGLEVEPQRMVELEIAFTGKMKRLVEELKD